jgi:hypothetical protein
MRWPLPIIGLAVLALAGCTADHDVLLALGDDGGRPTVYYEPCADASDYSLTLYDLGTDPEGGEDLDPIWRITHPGPIEQLSGIRLFTAPDGWTTSTAPPTGFGWADDHTYELLLRSDGPYDATIQWRPGDLETGRLLNRDNGAPEPVELATWDDRVRDHCAD